MDTNDSIRDALVKGLVNPWVGLAFVVGLVIGYIIGRTGV